MNLPFSEEDLARRLDRVLVIHDRDAHDDVIRVLLEDPGP